MIKGTLFRQTMFAEFEYIAHEKAAKGEPMTDRDVRHETVHFYQQLALLILPFYLLYLLFWLLALVRYRNWVQAYRAIPFERSAYRLESVRDKSPLAQAFDWLRCLTDKTK